MFKIIAVLAATAGGAGYGLYTYTDLFDSHGCPLSGKQACGLKPAPVSAGPDCCLKPEACCEDVAPCCSAEKVTAKAKPAAGCADVTCCSEKSAKVAATVALCCADPCLTCFLLACDGCADCAVCCGAGADNAKAAVVGPAAVFAAKK